jgi:drug/metabolite transporter (DMT)-like permease
MTPLLFLLVILAALLHASWNLLVKITDDRVLAMYLLQTLMGVMGLAMLLVFPFPNTASIPFAITSGILHTSYNLFLARSYRHGDLSVVYPVARGTAPLITLVATHLFTTDTISIQATLGVVVLIIGIWLIALSSNIWKQDRLTFMFALITSCFIGAYTVVDGLGGRASGNASGYTGLVFMLDAIGMLLAGAYLRGWVIFSEATKIWKRGVLGAALSGSAYWIVIWAMAQAPIAAVAALRETSILFALVFSHQVLKEQMGWRRLVGVACVVAGAMALRG